MAKSGVVHTPKSANKSWVELCDNDLSDSSENEEISTLNNRPESQKTNIEECAVAIKKEPKEREDSENIPAKVSEISASKMNIGKDDSPLSFSYASILKNSSSKNNIKTPRTPTKITEKVPDSGDVNPGKSVKREIQREFLHEDLSISSHLDIFHMESPLKLEPIDEAMASPLKSDKVAMKRGCPTKLMLDEDAMMPDDLLMPSPKKVTRISTRRKREPGESPLTCKRTKQSSRSYGTPRCVLPVEPPTEELETDEQILMRRQKQIDYGKNTIGYERYCQMVPREKRHRKHPNTPPKHVKYSRRAWDGLIRQWRQKLHFWDPPSEGGGNIDDLDISSMSDASSDTVSQPATPRDQRITRRSSRISVRSSTSESSSITDDTGCSPLKMN